MELLAAGMSVKYPASQQWLPSVVAWVACLLGFWPDTSPLGFWQRIRPRMDDENQVKEQRQGGAVMGVYSVVHER